MENTTSFEELAIMVLCHEQAKKNLMTKVTRGELSVTEYIERVKALDYNLELAQYEYVSMNRVFDPVPDYHGSNVKLPICTN